MCPSRFPGKQVQSGIRSEEIQWGVMPVREREQEGGGEKAESRRDDGPAEPHTRGSGGEALAALRHSALAAAGAAPPNPAVSLRGRSSMPPRQQGRPTR